MTEQEQHEHLLAEYVSRLLCVKEWYVRELRGLKSREPGPTLVKPPVNFGSGDARLSFQELLSPFSFGLVPTVANGYTMYRTILKEFDGLGGTTREGGAEDASKIFYEDWFNPMGDPKLGRLFPDVEKQDGLDAPPVEGLPFVHESDCVHSISFESERPR